MTPNEIADFLEQYNLWRRGNEEIEMPNPAELGEVLELAIEHLRGQDEQ